VGHEHVCLSRRTTDDEMGGWMRGCNVEVGTWDYAKLHHRNGWWNGRRHEEGSRGVTWNRKHNVLGPYRVVVVLPGWFFSTRRGPGLPLGTPRAWNRKHNVLGYRVVVVLLGWVFSTRRGPGLSLGTRRSAGHAIGPREKSFQKMWLSTIYCLGHLKNVVP
jgi:hypothetical protein